MIFSSVTRISSPDRKRETEHVPSQMKTNYLSCICHLRPSPSCLCCWHHLPCMGTHGPGGSTGNLWSQRTAQGTRRCRVSFSGCWQELSWDGRSQLATTYTTEGKADEKSDSAVPMLPEAQCCIEMGKIVKATSKAGGRRRRHALQLLHACKNIRSCFTVSCREKQLLISITTIITWRGNRDNSVLLSPTCSAQLSPRQLPCSVAFCLPCNHYNTSFPLASQCSDTHGEMQPGTTRSIKGCPLQRRKEFIRVPMQKPWTSRFQTLTAGQTAQCSFTTFFLTAHRTRKSPSLSSDLSGDG